MRELEEDASKNTPYSQMSNSPPGTVPVDMTSQMGLRGLLSFYILIFHCFHYSTEVDLQASSHMSFFFLLSGFALAVGYGAKTCDEMPCCMELASVDPDSNRMDAKRFYQNRFARIGPMYYFTQLMNLPVFFCGHGWIPPTETAVVVYMFVVDAFAAQTWLGGPPASLSGPGWTVSTLTFFYWVFPSLLPKLQKWDHASMRRGICVQFWINVVVAWALMGLGVGINAVGIFFWTATAWPPSRLPVFIMGVLAGLCTRRGWSFCDEVDPDSDVWASRADRHSALYWFLIIACSATSAVSNGSINPAMGFWGQTIMVYTQLMIVVAICKDEGKSWSSKIFRNSILQSLGVISMTLYLLHENLIYHCHWFFRNNEWWRDDPKMPVWCIPVVIGVALPSAWFLTHYVEAPLRKFLRAPKPTNQ